MTSYRLNWSLSVDDIKQRTDSLVSRVQAVFDSVGSITPTDIESGKSKLDDVLSPLDDILSSYITERNNLDFLQHVSPDKELRDASVASDKVLTDFDVDMEMRQDVFDVLVACQQKYGDEISGEKKRFLDRMIRDRRRNGLHLEPKIRDRVKELTKRMNDLSIDFSKNLNEENTTLEFTKEELDGVAEDVVSQLKPTEGGKLTITLKYPHYFPVMKQCRVPETRKKMEHAFNRRCIDTNTPILEELIKLRHEKAQLLGFKTHAHYILDVRMAKSPEAVMEFLTDISKKLKPLQNEELDRFLNYKREDSEKYGFKFDGKINIYDMRYYMTIAEEREYSVDQEKLKEYFPMAVVTKGLLAIYQELLGLKFTRIQDPHVWHKDVDMYKVEDADDGRLMGHFYLDLYPREGKYSHAACFGLQYSCKRADGRQPTVAAMVANFPRPGADGKPALLTHSDVETYFHEFGHVMHQICSQADYVMFSGTQVERDFVEAPSQMLENWCWEEESLRRMSSHYKTGSPIPDDLLKRLLKSRIANAGVFNLRQILLGSFDQHIHSRESADTAKTFAQLSEEILGISASPETNMPASFGHLGGGYDAQYYGYMWSEVFCMDMFVSRFGKEGIMNGSVGKDYRRYILQPGGSIDAADMLRNFLGRDPIPEPFLTSKGLKI